MTNEEKELLVEYLVDAGEQDADGDVEAQFMDWRQVREETVSGETHYKALLQAARVMARSFEEGQPGRGRSHAGLGPATRRTSLWRSRTSGGLSKRTRNRERRGWTDCAGWR